MQYVGYDQLNVIRLKDDREAISFELFIDTVFKNPSNVIYCVKRGKLCGIISSGDVKRAYRAGEKFLQVNKNFVKLLPDESMKAREIFCKRENINSIPVVNPEGKLLGDYRRCDKFNLKSYAPDGKAWFELSEKICLLRPCKLIKEKQETYKEFKSFLLSNGLSVFSINWDEISGCIDRADKFLVIDSDEYRAMWGILDLLGLKDASYKILTYKQFTEYTCRNKYAAENYLRQIKNEGISILNLVFKQDTVSSKSLYAEVQDKMVTQTIARNSREVQKKFFCELYTPEYADSIINLPFSQIGGISGKLKDCKSRFLNVRDGERYTVGQPERYQKTIYFVGPCFIFGHLVEDKYTIESFLQKRINSIGSINIKVVNCGSLYYAGFGELEKRIARMKELPLKKGDIVVIHLANLSFSDITELNLMDVLTHNHTEAGWIWDTEIRHSNHKIHALYAEAIYHALQDELMKKIDGQGEKLGVETENVVKEMYIDRYFADFTPESYQKVGSIVMNCNPFTYGHHYLIEQACKMVDFLIIFVVQEDASLFSFEERFTMVCEGTKDLDNVMVVPSGAFILSKTSFPQYFVKEADEDIVYNVECDITCFAENIAPYLNITYRFVGEEPEDAVTNEYNLAMKRILPLKGIKLIEIPRKERNGQCISASLVRRYLQEMDLDKLQELVPESTAKLLFYR